MSKDLSPAREDAERSKNRTEDAITDLQPAARGDQYGNGTRGDSSASHPSGLQRTVGAVRMLIPLLGKVLPLLDGNVAAVAANLLLPRLQAQSVDIYPLESALLKVREELALMRDKAAEHDTAFKRIDGQLESVRDAVERSVAEQREMAENVGRIQGRLLLFSAVGMVLLALSIGVNVALFFYVRGTIH